MAGSTTCCGRPGTVHTGSGISFSLTRSLAGASAEDPGSLRTGGVRVIAAIVVTLVLSLAVTGVQADQVVRPGAIEFEEQDSVAAVPGDADDELEEDSERLGPGSREFVVAPLPSRSPVLGWTLSVPALVFYRPGDSAPEDTAWITGVSGFYAENDSWSAGAFHRMSLRQDRWRIMAAAAYADVNYDYFGIGEDADRSISLNQPLAFVMVEALAQVYPNLFVGLRGTYSQTEVKLNIPPDALPPGLEPPDIGLDFDLTTLSPRLVYDTRDTEFYPGAGLYLNSKIDIARESLGGDRDYEKYDLRLNWYRRLGDSIILATRAATEYVSGNAPFFRYPAFGAKSDLRGYQAGTYRDRFLFAAQAELRYRFRPRFGVVAFAGLGTVAPDFGEWDKSLSAIGAGFRWVVAAGNNVSVRIDVARGRDDTEFYLGIGEAF